MKTNKKTVKQEDRLAALRDQAEKLCEKYNEKLEQEALQAFDQSETAQLFNDNIEPVSLALILRDIAVDCGVGICPMSALAYDSLYQLLMADPSTTYMCWEYVEPDSPRIGAHVTAEDLIAKTCCIRTFGTKAAESKRTLIGLFKLLASNAASYAKHKKSSSLLEWVEIYDLLREKGLEKAPHFGLIFSEHESRRLVALDKSASKRLYLESVAETLPPYRQLTPDEILKAARKMWDKK